jgi:hypothetical protein
MIARLPAEVPMSSPDPITDPKAYQDLLISLVGPDDPAEVQRATPAAIRSLVAEAGSHASTRPEVGEWSVIECLAHMLDAEIVASGRYRWILAHDQPDLPGYDQDLWVDRLHQPVEDADQLFALFEPLRAANVALWERTSDEQRDRIGMHRERGPESYRLTFTLMAGHDRFHLEQARRALASLSADPAR